MAETESEVVSTSGFKVRPPPKVAKRDENTQNSEASSQSSELLASKTNSKHARLRELTKELHGLEAKLRLGGGPDKVDKQHKQGKLTARERIGCLLDPGSFTEFDALARHRATDFGVAANRPYGDGVVTGYGTVDDRPVCVFSQDFTVFGGSLGEYDDYKKGEKGKGQRGSAAEEIGAAPAAGVVTTIGRVGGREVVVVANDATVKAGSWWPETIKKILRAQEIAMRSHVPIIYLVDSAGVNLPYQGGVFPGQYGASRIFYYNSIMRRYLKVPQIAAVMGPCIAGGAYLPALSDIIIMVEGTSFMGLGGANLVKGATG